jgi:alanyl-tRNA synthetase
VGDKARAAIDVERRNDIMRNHSATHLLHQALRTVLGTHVRQSGSLVGPEYFRFDFTHVGAVTPEELLRIQGIVNGVIRSNLSTDKRETTYRQAISGGALAFFGERYPHRVRVLAIGDFSYEVCGGTHIDRSGDIGTFRIITEGGIGSGIRRIEAVSGRGADAWIDERILWFDEVSERLQVRPAEIPRRISTLMSEVDSSRKMVSTSRREASLKQVETLLEKKQTIGTYTVVASQVFVDDLESMREIGDWVRDKIKTGMVMLGVILAGRPSLLVMVTADLVTKGHDARDIVKVAAEVIGGGGGGKPELAQAGGRDSSNLTKALEAAVEFVQGKLV